MLHSLRSNKGSFKPINFKSGFNVVLAERTKEATKKDSRNGLGKSTLIEIIHFCLGADKGDTLKKKQMDDWTFSLDLDLAGARYLVTRTTSDDKKVLIDGDFSNWPIKPELVGSTSKGTMPIKDWNRILGILMFGLQPSYDYKYVPTFRSLISYFIRRNGQRGAFLNPFQHYGNQHEVDKQVNNSYLLGLGWEYASRWQVLKDRADALDHLRTEARSGLLPNFMGTIGELEAKRVRLEKQVEEEELNLAEFKVHPQYRKLETDANGLTDGIHDLVNRNICDRKFLENFELSLEEEIDAKPESVVEMYKEAGVVLPSMISKRLEDVMAFHKQVVANRKDFLKSEMDRIRRDIAQREQHLRELSDERTQLMLVLQKHGALEEFTALQNNHQKAVAELNEIKMRLDNLKNFEQGKSAIKVELEVLLQQAIADKNERAAQVGRAILLFNSNSEALYNAPGTLSINLTKTGYKFDVEIERSGSHGIGNMKIFCYDLMLAQLWSREANPMFPLIHDSIMFADVDERQYAMALELAARESRNRGFQYICTLNSDKLPVKDFTPGFKVDGFVIRTLTDSTEDGGLLGIRF